MPARQQYRGLLRTQGLFAQKALSPEHLPPSALPFKLPAFAPDAKATRMTLETPEALKARKMLQLDAVLEAMAAETRDVSKAFFHGWVLSAAMELWDRGVLTQEERLAIEARATHIANPGTEE